MEPGSGLGEVPQLTPMHQQLCFAQHLATSILGQAGVDTGIMLGHIPEHQGIGCPFLLLAEPRAVHQLDTVLEAQVVG